MAPDADVASTVTFECAASLGAVVSGAEPGVVFGVEFDVVFGDEFDGVFDVVSGMVSVVGLLEESLLQADIPKANVRTVSTPETLFLQLH